MHMWHIHTHTYTHTHTHTSVFMALQMANNSTESSPCCDTDGKMAVERDTETPTSKPWRQSHDEVRS